MDQLARQIIAVPQIKRIIFVCGTVSTADLIYETIKEMQLERVTIVAYTKSIRLAIQNKVMNPDCDIDVHTCVVNFANEEELLAEPGMDLDEIAICFDGIRNGNRVTQYAKLKPRYVFGVVNKDDINSFLVWEAFRKCSRKVCLISYKNKNEVLDWNANASGIELSVIFPMYNVAAYLPECINSIIQWKADYVEYLFVDDGSPDDSAKIVENYAKIDSRVKLLKKENGGCASARQYGLDHARGRYVGFVDPDDYIDPTMFKKLYKRALIGSYEIAYCGYNELYENDGSIREIEDCYYEPYSDGTTDQESINTLIHALRVAIWRGIYSRDLIDRNSIHFYTDLRRFDDLPFKVEVFSKARSVVAIPEHLYYYRLARPGQDVAADDERLYVHFPIFTYLDRFIRKSSDQRQLDNLQIVKLHTHQYALRKIKTELIAEYVEQASKDIRSNFKFLEGLYILRRFSRNDLMWYYALYFNLPSLVIKLVKKNK